MYIDPITIQWLIIGGAAFCAFMIGKLLGEKKLEDQIEDTIEYLIQEGFIKARRNGLGQWEIEKFDEN